LGLPCSLIDGENCLLFDIGDIDGAVDKLILANNLERRLKLAAKALELVNSKYTIKKSIDAWNACFSAITQSSCKPHVNQSSRLNDKGRLNTFFGMLLGENSYDVVETIKRLLKFRIQHPEAGSEWPHSYSKLSSKASELDDYLDAVVDTSVDTPWTSNLHLPMVFPYFGKLLFNSALNTFPIGSAKISPASSDEGKSKPEVSFIIGHRGTERADLLLNTINSIGAQTDCKIECIVVEQDQKERIKDQLPNWVRYVFTRVKEPDAPYSRSWAFNVGAEHARSNCLIFHDNDLLVPECYASETLKQYKNGFEFINLKRFIFYLTRESSDALNSGKKLSAQLEIESIMQNALGGGSVGASREAFNRIGKFDERFVGWGGEDNEFWERASTGKIWPFANLPLVHQWHPHQAEKSTTQGLDKNHIYWKLQAQSPDERIKTLRSKEN